MLSCQVTDAPVRLDYRRNGLSSQSDNWVDYKNRLTFCRRILNVDGHSIAEVGR